MTGAKRGERLGRWTLVMLLGHGGNGDVWKATDELGDWAAVKVLRRRDRDRLPRFRDEVAFHQQFPGLRGVLSVVESSLPDSLAEPAWYAMPVAVPIRKALGVDAEPHAVIGAMASIADTLASLDEMGVWHRDIKPENLFELAGQCLVGDFGLVRYPMKEPLTQHGRRLGPVDYMAPEMREDADSAAPGPADVYSLAKTLWVLLAAATLPLPGPHRPDDEAYALSMRLNHERAPELDRLIERATLHDPRRRITIGCFSRELSACLEVPPERRPGADRAALIERISALTATNRHHEQATRRTRKLFNAAEYNLREIATSPTYHELARALPGFRSTYSNGSVALQCVIPRPAAMYGEIGWVGHTSSQGRHWPISVTIATGVRLDSDEETLTLVGLLAVDRSNPDMLERYVVATPQVTVPLGSAQQVVASHRIAADLANGVDEALRRVATLLATDDKPVHPRELSPLLTVGATFHADRRTVTATFDAATALMGLSALLMDMDGVVHVEQQLGRVAGRIDYDLPLPMPFRGGQYEVQVRDQSASILGVARVQIVWRHATFTMS